MTFTRLVNGAIWHGQASWNGMDPLESRHGLPGDEGDTHSRYLEGAAHGVIVGCSTRFAAEVCGLRAG
jgi:hypothetical protein